MKKLTILLTMMFLLSLPLQSTALTLFGVGPRAGYYKAADAEEGRMLFGAAARFKLGLIAFEGSIDYKSEEYAQGLLAVTSWPVMASVLIYPIPIVYGIAGMGWYNTTYEIKPTQLNLMQLQPVKETTQETGWHFGGGVELPLGSMTLAADVRYVFLNYDFSEMPYSEEIDANFWAATVSIFFGF